VSPSDRADVVVIGGGVLGCSIAYHLVRGAKLSVRVIERNDVASGATARSAGLVSFGRFHAETLRMVRRTRQAIGELEDTLGAAVEFHRVGSLRLAASPEREAEVETIDTLLRAHGVEVRSIGADEARRLVPWLDASTARRISHVPDDGFVDAYRLASAYARAARIQGARFDVRTAVRRILHDGRRVMGVETDRGTVTAEAVVDAAGAWSIGLAEGMGVGLPTSPVRSHYWITAPEPGTSRDHPTVLLPDARAYVRPEVGGLLIGVQEPESRTYDARRLPADIAEFPLSEMDEDWNLILDHAPVLRSFMPRLDDLGIAHHIAGLSTYTPDGRFLIGPVGPVAGFIVASGCCGTGVSASGGIGEAVADLVLGMPAKIDPAPFRPDRFGSVDPYDPAFQRRCAMARGDKSRRR
jgi:4-methylaminobutanoate oxidase (formaldehyde-forming)